MITSAKIMKFEPQFRASTPELRAQIQHLSLALRDHEAARGERARARKDADAAKFEMAVEALACNLIVVTATGAASMLAIPRSNGVMWPGGSTPNRVYGTHFLTAIRLMSQLGLIEEGERGYHFSDTAKLASTIMPTVKLNSYLQLSPPDWRAVQQIDDEALILLRTKKRAGKAELQPFAQNKRTQQLARELIRVNTVLREAQIEIAGLSDNLTLGDDGRIVVPFRRTLRRIFNNAKWQHGGRLAGGFWMSMPRGERHRIRINGEEVREVDYRQLHPRLAYARALQPQPEGDLYDIVGDGTGRDGWKRLFNALLFAKGPLKNWPKDTLQHFPAGTKLKDACNLLREKHAPIAHLFGEQLGFSLMKSESDMLIRVMTDLAASGCVCLPLHDAVIVGASHVEMAAKMMQGVFEAGSTHPVGAIVSAK